LRPRTWYHCSSVDLGPSFVAKRITPSKGDTEPCTPRLCVCRTVAACFAAKLFPPRRVYVYKTERPRRAVKPVNVWDMCVTGERWLIPPAPMVLDRIIDDGTVDRATLAVRMYHISRRANSSLRTRVAQYSVALGVLGGPAWESRRVDDMLHVLGMEDLDPEDFLLEMCV